MFNENWRGMNILIVGSGAREHAIAKVLCYSRHKPKLFCCGTQINPGITALTYDYCLSDITITDDIIKQAQQWRIDLAIIGPEAPLEQGLADALWDIGIPVIGPKKQLAQIETSKAFARELMHKYQIPGLPQFKVFHSMDGIEAFLNTLGDEGYVVKMNGLKAGKGVKVAGEHLHSIQEALDFCEEIIQAKQSLVIEERLIGQEFSFMCFSDGNSLQPMPLVQDHKRAFEGDKGPNTGGMGSYSAADHSLPFLNAVDVKTALAINQSIIEALKEETGDRFIGILYGGFIATSQGVSVIEFNARFGDPEALNVLSILESDFVELCWAMIQGDLQSSEAKFSHKATVCKYLVPEGYPDSPKVNEQIDVSSLKNKDYLYLGAVHEQDGILYATGSRAAACVGIADNINEAEQIAEYSVNQIKGALLHRKDIGTEKLIDERIDCMKRLRQL